MSSVMKSIPSILGSGSGPGAPDREASSSVASGFGAIWRAPELHGRPRIRMEAAKAYDDAVARAARLLEQTREKAEELIDAARAEAERIIAQARDMEAQIKNEAFRSGYEDGRKEIEKTMMSKIEGLITGLDKAREAILGQRMEAMKSAEGELVDLACEIASRIICAEIARDNSSVVNVAKEALRYTTGEGRIVVRVADADLEAATNALPQLEAVIDGIHELEILPDPRVESGGCIVETEYGTVDARISQQLSQIRRHLDDARAASAE
ncbi:MAG TPA: hypothetical protein GX509_05160 [Firmicutes bacterium]|nr:hypothetical protein [Bacillota bacterium]